jgi:uncharacterized protein Yka (UPF0111/DUF47 family)
MERLNKNTGIIWKNKAISRQIENKDLRKRLKESKGSRDQWKKKASERKGEIKKLEMEIDRIKKNLMKIIS